MISGEPPGPKPPVYVLGTGEAAETPLVSMMEDFTSSKAFRLSAARAFAEAGLGTSDVDHLMIYDAFAHLPIYGLEDLGFCRKGEAASFIWERNTAPASARMSASLTGSSPMGANGCNDASGRNFTATKKAIPT